MAQPSYTMAGSSRCSSFGAIANAQPDVTPEALGLAYRSDLVRYPGYICFSVHKHAQGALQRCPPEHRLERWSMLQAVLSTMLEEIQGEARQRIEQHKSQVRPLLCCRSVLWHLQPMLCLTDM